MIEVIVMMVVVMMIMINMMMVLNGQDAYISISRSTLHLYHLSLSLGG
jgi:hypothetical protein